MKIIAGEWKRRTLRAPSGDTTRPTAGRTRETLFSMLVSRIGSFDDLRVADLFAGSGALGLEALSRGALSCLFAENDAAAIRALRSNIAALRAQSRCDVRACSVLALGPAPAPFDLLFLDPPYGTNAGAVAIDKLARLGWIGPSSWVSLEVGAKEEVSLKKLTVETERNVGAAKLVLARLPRT